MFKQPQRMAIGFWLMLALGLPSPELFAAPTSFDLDRISNVVVLFLENHSFDNLYGLYPGADGIKNAPPETLRQLDLEGKPYLKLPRVINASQTPPEVDARFPLDLPNGPFAINRFVDPKDKIPDLTHRFYQHQAQMNGGKMNRFVAHTNAGGLTMGYYEDPALPLREYAKRYTLLDHFFAAAFGGSFLNHMWMACACTPWEAHPPASNRIHLAADGVVTRDGAFTQDGFAVNNILPAFGPGNLTGCSHPSVSPPWVTDCLIGMLTGLGMRPVGMMPEGALLIQPFSSIISPIPISSATGMALKIVSAIFWTAKISKRRW